jgi:glycosyltransferase involved in cell wall biosynthesis
VTARLRVGIDAWGAGGRAVYSGMGQYTAALLRGLPTVPEIDVVAYGAPEEARPSWLPSTVSWRPLGSWRAGKLAAIHSRTMVLPRAVASDDIDVLHVPAVHVRPSFPPVPRVRCPLVVTMHDAIPLSYYGDTLPGRTRAFYRWNLRRARSAERILTVSNAARREIAHYAQVPIERVGVVTSAVEFAPTRDGSAPSTKGLPSSYVLYAGSYEPRKNLAGTLRAFAGYVRAGGNLDLVAITEAESGYAAAVHDLLGGLQCRDRVHLIHDVPEVELHALYTGASAVVFPSFAEGLGLPPIQAAMCGVPVVVSKLEVFDETVGSVAVRADPYDPASMQAAITIATSDPEVRARTAHAAPAIAARFSVDACVGDHVAVYRSLGDRRNASV